MMLKNDIVNDIGQVKLNAIHNGSIINNVKKIQYNLFFGFFVHKIDRISFRGPNGIHVKNNKLKYIHFDQMKMDIFLFIRILNMRSWTVSRIG